MKRTIAVAAFAAGFGLAASAWAGGVVDISKTPYGVAAQSTGCPNPLVLKDAFGVSRQIATMTDENGNCVFSVRNATVGKQHDEIVEKLGARIDALTEEVSELRAVLGDESRDSHPGRTLPTDRPPVR